VELEQDPHTLRPMILDPLTFTVSNSEFSLLIKGTRNFCSDGNNHIPFGKDLRKSQQLHDLRTCIIHVWSTRPFI